MHAPPHHPTVDLLVDDVLAHGAYAVLDVRLPRNLGIPRHVRRGRGGLAILLDGAIELCEDDEAPVVLRRGPITLADGRPLAARVLEPTRLIAVLPAGAAALLPAISDPRALPDDRVALLAAAGVTLLPPLRGR